MTNYFYSEDFQDLPKSQKKQDTKTRLHAPSIFTMKIILGYGAALSVMKTNSIGQLKILLN
jgi:hypothetical protein